ncbi:MAG TPA: glycosyltransferase family 2 protein, partial [Rhodothermales bacterium]|nr:glycosyltransferase family 2 protein [Rhodothermales bacterium]
MATAPDDRHPGLDPGSRTTAPDDGHPGLDPGSRTTRPLISVILPTFNRPGYLREAAASILGQTVEDLELLIVDDCSTDETDAVIADLCREDRRVAGLRTESNGGCNRARNLALDRAKGRCIAFLDDDDVAVPGRFESCLAALEARPSSGFASCGYGFIDARGTRLPGSAPEFDAGVE